MQKTMQEHAAVFRTAVSPHPPSSPTALKLHSFLGKKTSVVAQFTHGHGVVAWYLFSPSLNESVKNKVQDNLELIGDRAQGLS